MRGLLALLVIALAVRCNVEADFSGAIETTTLNADEYQQEIARIDRLLFREEPLGKDGPKALETELDDLAKRVKAEGPDSKFLRLESLELQLLAKKAGRLSSEGTGAALQNDWMRIRNNLFDDRAWFVRSAADLEYAASVVDTAQEEMAAVEEEPALPFGTTEDEPRSTLTGQWQVRAMRMNGKPSDDAELMHSIWTFEEPRLTTMDRDGNTAVFEYRREDNLLFVSGAEGMGWMLYAIDGNGLRIAFHDNFAGKPRSLDADPSRPDPMHVLLSLVPVR
jgi:hypothetical protein